MWPDYAERINSNYRQQKNDIKTRIGTPPTPVVDLIVSGEHEQLVHKFLVNYEKVLAAVLKNPQIVSVITHVVIDVVTIVHLDSLKNNYNWSYGYCYDSYPL